MIQSLVEPVCGVHPGVLDLVDPLHAGVEGVGIDQGDQDGP